MTKPDFYMNSCTESHWWWLTISSFDIMIYGWDSKLGNSCRGVHAMLMEVWMADWWNFMDSGSAEPCVTEFWCQLRSLHKVYWWWLRRQCVVTSCPFGCGGSVDHHLRSLVCWSLWTWAQNACQLWDEGVQDAFASLDSRECVGMWVGMKFVLVAVQLRVHVAGVGRCKQPQ
jgi:hypothetical protein